MESPLSLLYNTSDSTMTMTQPLSSYSTAQSGNVNPGGSACSSGPSSSGSSTTESGVGLSQPPTFGGNFHFTGGRNGPLTMPESATMATPLSHPVVDKRKSDSMLDIYVYDYLRKRNLGETAARFLEEAEIDNSADSLKAPIDISQGFLYEWWTVFWDFYNARASKPSSNEAISFLNTMKQMTHVQNAQKSQNMRSASSAPASSAIPQGRPLASPATPQPQYSTPDPTIVTEQAAFQQLQHQYQHQHQQKISQAQQQQQQSLNAYRMQMLAGQQQQQQIINQQHQAQQAAYHQQQQAIQPQRTPQAIQSQLTVLLTQHLAQMGMSNNQFNGLPANQKQAIIHRVMASSNLNAVPSPSNTLQPYSPLPQHQSLQMSPKAQSLLHNQQQQQQHMSQSSKRPRMEDKQSNQQNQQQFKALDHMQQLQLMAVQKQQLQHLKPQQQPIPQLSARQNSAQLDSQPPPSAPMYGAQQGTDNNVLFAVNINDLIDPPEKSHSSSAGTDFREFLNASQNSNDNVGNNGEKVEEDFDVAYLNSLDPSQPIDFGASNSMMTSSNSTSFNSSTTSQGTGVSAGIAVDSSLSDAKDWNDAEVESWLNLDS